MGDWDSDLPNGDGIIYLPDTLLYEGSFAEGRPNGRGQVQFLNHKCVYEGDIANGQANGEGVFTNSQDKYTFRGQWQHSKPKTGRLDFATNGTIIEFEDYDKNLAKITYEDHKVYHGQTDLKTFLPEGVGEVSFPDNSRYNGEFMAGKMHGKGVFQWRNAQPGRCDEKYDGDYQYGKKHGNGKFTFSSGNVYDGQWVNGKREGRGILVDKHGAEISNGVWFKGKILDSKQEDLNLNMEEHIINNGEQLEQKLESSGQKV